MQEPMWEDPANAVGGRWTIQQAQYTDMTKWLKLVKEVMTGDTFSKAFVNGLVQWGHRVSLSSRSHCECVSTHVASVRLLCAALTCLSSECLLLHPMLHTGQLDLERMQLSLSLSLLLHCMALTPSLHFHMNLNQNKLLSSRCDYITVISRY